MLSQRRMAKALGLTPPQVHKLVKRGMPLSSPEAAHRWRLDHLDYRMKDPPLRIRVDPRTPVEVANQMFEFAALDFDGCAPGLRVALGNVPREQRHQVRLDVAVTQQLIAPALAAVADVLQPEPGAPMTDADAEGGGAFLYAIAAGEIFPVGNKLHISPSAHHLVAEPTAR